jgi:hypothetical protein
LVVLPTYPTASTSATTPAAATTSTTTPAAAIPSSQHPTDRVYHHQQQAPTTHPVALAGSRASQLVRIAHRGLLHHQLSAADTTAASAAAAITAAADTTAAPLTGPAAAAPPASTTSTVTRLQQWPAAAAAATVPFCYDSQQAVFSDPTADKEAAAAQPLAAAVQSVAAAAPNTAINTLGIAAADYNSDFILPHSLVKQLYSSTGTGEGSNISESMSGRAMITTSAGVAASLDDEMMNIGSSSLGLEQQYYSKHHAYVFHTQFARYFVHQWIAGLRRSTYHHVMSSCRSHHHK